MPSKAAASARWQRRPALKSSGFSLLEALVTLVVVALVAALLMQSLIYVLGMRERLLHHDRQARMALLEERWFRDSVAGALADTPAGLGPFRGDARGFSKPSASPLIGPGVATARWEVHGGTDLGLDYIEGEARFTVLGPGLQSANFAYLDRHGRWLEVWPNAEQPEEALPRAVRFAAQGRVGHYHWIAVVDAGSELPPFLSAAAAGADAGF